MKAKHQYHSLNSHHKQLHIITNTLQQTKSQITKYLLSKIRFNLTDTTIQFIRNNFTSTSYNIFNQSHTDMRNKNRNTLISRDPQWQSKIHKSQQKDYDCQKNTHFAIINSDKPKQQFKFEVQLQRNPESNSNFMVQNWWKTEDKGARNKLIPSFQKTAAGFHKQRKQYTSNKFYETSVNGFIVTNNRPMSKKQNRDKIIMSKPHQSKLMTQEDEIQHSQGKPVKCFRLSLQPQKPELSRRPETSKGQRKRGVNTNNDTFEEQLMNQFIPCLTEQQQQFCNSKKEEMGTRSHNLKKKRSHPLSAANKKSRDVGDLIKLNSNTHRRSVGDFVVPFNTTISPDFLCLFANGK